MMGLGFNFTLILTKDGGLFHSFLKPNLDTSGFYHTFDTQLSTPVGPDWSKESKQEIINLWLNTQLAHTGRKNPSKKKKSWEIDLADFNKCDARIGREKFEFLFRSSVGTLGHTYILFEEILARPLFESCLAKGMKPSFEAEVALKYSPYSNPKYKIIYDDVFWHLNRETPVETFERLLARQQFDGLRFFLKSLFPKVDEAVDHVLRLETLTALLKDSGTVILGAGSKPKGALLHHSTTNTEFALGTRGQITFHAYVGREIRIENGSLALLGEVYKKCRKMFFEARSQQRKPIKGREWS